MYEEFKNKVYDKVIKDSNYCKIVKLGLWETNKKLYFAENTVAQSSSRVIDKKEDLKSYERLITIDVTSIDTFKKENNVKKVDLIKMDIEGAELPALKGGIETIRKDRPQLVISIYHSLDDLIEIPLYLHENLDNYIFKLGHYSHNSLESVLYAIPKELME